MPVDLVSTHQGPRGDWSSSIVRDGTVIAYEYGGKAHCNAWCRGAQARREGEKRRSPWAGRDSMSSRGYANAWLRGWDGMDKALGVVA